MMKNFLKLALYRSLLGCLAFFGVGGGSMAYGQYEEAAWAKIDTLQSLMSEAQHRSIDVKREETLLWFSKEFLKFADWDEAHQPELERLFGYYAPYEAEKKNYAQTLPDLERQKVVEMLDKGIDELRKVLDGRIRRRAVVDIDWENIELGEGVLLSQGEPIFLFDYFSKSVGISLTDTQVYNDHLGAIYHGGEHLYEVNQDRAINPFLLKEDGTFDQEKLRLLTDIPNTNVGFLLLWNMGMPQWIYDQEPEVSKGRSLFTGFDVDNPLMREVWAKVIKKSAELNQGKKVTQLGYILSNEPHWFSEEGHWTQRYLEMNSISSYTLNKFRDWLTHKYNGDIQVLNQNWQSSFDDFSSVEIDIPIQKSLRGTPKWYDWCRFNMDRGIDWFTFLQGALLEGDSLAQTHIKIMPKMFMDDYRSHGIDFEALTELTTMIGNDAKTRGGRDLRTKRPEAWEERYAYYWQELALPFDFLESVAPNKVNINSETHYLSSSQWRDLNTSTDYTRNCFWLSTLHGMDVGISWFWARDPDGSPEDRLEGELNFFDPALAGSYAGSVNMQPQTANEVAQVMMDLNSYAKEILALRNQRKPLRIFYSETSAINQKTFMSELYRDVYEPLYFEGFPLGFATEKILRGQDHEDWDAVLVHKVEYVTDAEFEALQAYLDQGGSIIIDRGVSLTKNEYGQKRAQNLRPSPGKLIFMEAGLSPNELSKLALSAISNQLPAIVLSEDNASPFKGCTWRVVENPEGEGYWMTVVNLGKNPAKLKVSSREGRPISCTNLLTGEMMGDQFELISQGVLLLEVNKN